MSQYGSKWVDVSYENISAGVEIDVADSLSGVAGENVTWTLDTAGTLTLKGTGEIRFYVYNEYPAPWYGSRGIIKSVKISDGITGIGNSAFEYLPNLKSVSIPDSVEWTIGEYSFWCTRGTIYGYSGSYAEAYAEQNGKTFIALDSNNDVTLDYVDIFRLPNKTRYYVTEELDTEGLILKLTYSNGTIEKVSEGYKYVDIVIE